MELRTNDRTVVTLGVLALVLVLGVAWALHKVSQPFPAKATPPPICEDVTVNAGDTIQTGQVLVNVLNASDASRLAQSTQAKLVGLGFGAGERGNTHLRRTDFVAQVWTPDDSSSPAARMVASYLGDDVRGVQRDAGYLGITVVLGDRFKKVRRGMPSITAPQESTVCAPTKTNDGLVDTLGGAG